jgi:hypothetical protein
MKRIQSSFNIKKNLNYEIIKIFTKKKSVQNLSLRNNQIDDDAVNYLAYSLGDIRRQNTKLLTLNLSCNKISDSGAIYLARVCFQSFLFIIYYFILNFINFVKALRTNRTLLSLNLSQNNIGDIGAKALADVTFAYYCSNILIF